MRTTTVRLASRLADFFTPTTEELAAAATAAAEQREYAIIFDGPGGFDFTGASLKGEALEATMESLLSAIFGKLPTGVQSYDTRSCPGFKSGSFEFITLNIKLRS